MMKIELDLKKKLLIVDVLPNSEYEIFSHGIYFKNEEGDREFIAGKYKYLCNWAELTEGIASELVESPIDKWGDDKYRYLDYKHEGCYDLKFAKESFISAIESAGFYWLENQLAEFPKIDDYVFEYHPELVGNPKEYNHDQFESDVIEWQEAEAKTYKNPLIFEICGK